MSSSSTKKIECRDELDAVSLYNSDKPITAFIVDSAGSIGPSRLMKIYRENTKGWFTK